MDHTDEQELREAYYEDTLTLAEIGERAGVSGAAVRKQMNKYGLERRPPGPRDPDRLCFWTSEKGYQRGRHIYHGTEEHFKIHRLAAVAWFGFDAVAGNDVHHIDGAPQHNAESNFKLVTRSEHASIERPWQS